MTLEEKRELIGEYCHNVEDCEQCVFHADTNPDSWCRHHHHSKLPECKVDEVLEKFTQDNPVTHPSHYTQGNIQCIDAMESAFGKEAVATWCKLNAFKYVWRAEHKNGMEDIDKAIWYLNKFKELKSVG